MDKVEKVGTLHTSKDSPQKKQNRKKGVDLGHTQNTDHSRRVWELQGFDMARMKEVEPGRQEVCWQRRRQQIVKKALQCPL